MFFFTPQSIDAEISWRQERIRRDYQRPWWFQRKPAKPVIQRAGLPTVQARHAM